jgi:membrane protein YqaA with SNARE-associated domain
MTGETLAARPGLVRRCYDRMIVASHGPNALRSMLAVSFAESSFFPFPPDPILVPMMLARPNRAWYLATLCVIASVVGGWFGYAIGYFLFESIGAWVVSFYGLQDKFHEFQTMFATWGAWIIIAKGVTPIPYKIVAIASGLVQFNFLVFTIASIVARGVRFYMIAVLMHFYGDQVRHYVEKYTSAMFIGMLAIVAVGLGAVFLL